MEITEPTYRVAASSHEGRAKSHASEWHWYHLLPIAAAAIYIFTPILSWKFGVPGVIKFAGDALVIVMIALAFGRMLRVDHIPGAVLVVLALTLIGAIVAVFEGQSNFVTFYGWWMMFRFPMVGLFVYLVPDWPKSVPALLPRVLVGLLAFEVLVQIGLYFTGTREFDDLAGTFGYKGVGPFVYFILLVLSLALARWLVQGDWKMLFSTLALGSLAAAMGEMKLFIIAAPLLAILALGFHLLRGAQPRKVFFYVVFFVAAAATFLYAYDRLIVQELGQTPLDAYLNSERRDRYLDYTRQSGGGTNYLLGRNSELEYGWQSIQRDTTTLLFGHGIGSRQYSPELGLVGTGVEASVYGNYVGRSLLVMMYEMGLFGLLFLVGFSFLTAIVLYRAAKRDSDLDMNVIRFGVLFYTLFWPLWLWYKAIWIMPAPSILYWMLWGYAMQFSVKYSFRVVQDVKRAARRLPDRG